MAETVKGDQADKGWDTYQERVLRNEGTLEGLRQLVSETREADRKLVDQRSDSLARELERRADALEKLTVSERDANRREYREAIQKNYEQSREAIRTNHDQSHAEIASVREVHDLHIKKLTLRLEHEQKLAADKVAADITHIDERGRANLAQLEQQVQQWREADREARDLQAAEYARRLDELNKAREKQLDFQAQSVTRELFDASEAAWNVREKVDHDKINALERAMVGMQTTASADKIHEQMNLRTDALVKSSVEALHAKIGTQSDKIDELKSSRDKLAGKSIGRDALFGIVVAVVATLGTLIIVANILTSP